MPTARRKWTCPKCGQLWGIPQHKPDPKLCPECSKLPIPVTDDTQQKPASPAKNQIAGIPTYWFVSVSVWVLYFVFSMIVFSLEGSNWAYLVSGSLSELISEWRRLLIRSTIATIIPLVYFFPIQMAFYRNHPEKLPISLLAVFGGWTCIGWIVAIVWSSMPIKERKQQDA